jgi:hypothetical protein
MTRIGSLLLVATLVLCAACGRKEDTAPPVATPTITLARSQAAIGSPLEIKYKFVVASNAPAFDEDYWVFVHFLDTNDELMWTDDHRPPTPTRQWKPGDTVEYTRTVFVPKFPYTGQTTVEIGVFSPRTGVRLPLAGETRGQRSYQVAAFEMQHQNDNQFVVFKDGWHPTEIADDRVGTEWQWSKKDATISFRNPRRDVLFYLQVDLPASPSPEPRHVELRIGDAVVDQFDLKTNDEQLRRFPLSASQFGTDETVDLRISVDRTFIPATIPEMKNADPRELGVRVFRAYLEPR